ncbi:MAG: amino acid adenylation domain-containing protein, partial [Vulcanimicrobiaceae bacterium]
MTEAPQSIHGLFEAQVRRVPANIALIDGDRNIRYDELDSRANRLAQYLCTFELGPEPIVGICLDRSADLIVALLAVLKAGAAYLPLDPGYPAERTQFMLEDSGARLVITAPAQRKRIPAGFTAIDLVDAHDRIGRFPTEPPARAVAPVDRAYVIYTSGSTGRPKGVMIEHRNTLARLAWAAATFADDFSGVLAVTSICFDLSVFEIFGPLCAGGSVILARSALELATLSGAPVRLLNTVPSVAAALLDTGAIPASVRTVNLAGEPLDPRLVRELYAIGTIERVFNLYGPTEDTTYSVGALMTRDAERCPIGRPLPGTHVLVLDDALAPVANGVDGELFLGGVGVARGYLGRPELTRERFIERATPAGPQRFYRTGDIVRTNADGELEYIGRTDQQVKIRGFRIELGEIEAALRADAAVREAAVAALDATVNDRRLVAYVVPQSAPFDTAASRAALAKTLPPYMIPSEWIVLDEFPRTPNGKLDRAALPRPQWGQPARSDGRPADAATERAISGVWCDLLGHDGFGIDDDFFAVGGHSLLAL